VPRLPVGSAEPVSDGATPFGPTPPDVAEAPSPGAGGPKDALVWSVP